MSFDPEKFGLAMGDAIRRAVEPLVARIADLEKQLAERPDVKGFIANEVTVAVAALPAPKDGRDCDMQTVKRMVEEAVAALPAPKDGADGAPGKDGSSVTVDDLQPLMKAAIEALRRDADEAIKESLRPAEVARESLLKAVGELRQPQDGKSVTLEDVRPILDGAINAIKGQASEAIEKAIQAIPEPKNGQTGRDGTDGRDGKDGAKGADGAGIADLLIDRDGVLVATFTDGRMKNLGHIVGKDGKDGANGLDGVSFDAFELEYLPETHEVCVKASCSGRTKELRYPAGGIRPCGYWREGTKAKAGDAWVHDGSLWIARADSAAKPETKSADWLIAARRGRDGERGEKGANASPVTPIKLGAQ